MYYSAIGVLALMILLIENQDILLNRNGAFDVPSWKVYRRFLFAVIIYYITDILWGFLEYRKLSFLLFVDTAVYFLAMAIGVQLWTQYVTRYLDERDVFAKFFNGAGYFIATGVTVFSVINISDRYLMTCRNILNRLNPASVRKSNALTFCKLFKTNNYIIIRMNM